MTLLVTVTDLETGDSASEMIREGDYVCIVHDPCRIHNVMRLEAGRTHVVTIVDRITNRDGDQ